MSDWFPLPICRPNKENKHLKSNTCHVHWSNSIFARFHEMKWFCWSTYNYLLHFKPGDDRALSVFIVHYKCMSHSYFNSLSPKKFMKMLILHEYLLAKMTENFFKLHIFCTETKKTVSSWVTHKQIKYILIRQLLRGCLNRVYFICKATKVTPTHLALNYE